MVHQAFQWLIVLSRWKGRPRDARQKFSRTIPRPDKFSERHLDQSSILNSYDDLHQNPKLRDFERKNSAECINEQGGTKTLF